MSFDIFYDGARLKDVREGALNPLIDHVNKSLTPDVTKLKTDLADEQLKTAAAYKDTTLDLANSKLTFTRLDNSTDDVDLTSLINLIDHGIYVGDQTGHFVDRFPKLEFIGAEVRSKPSSPDTVLITIPQCEDIYGNATGTSEKINTITLTGKKGTSHISAGVMYIDLPDAGVAPPPTDPIKGEIKDEGAKDLKLVKVTGVTDASTMSDDGTLTINIPPQSGAATITGQVNGTPYQEITKIHVGGNVGASTIEHGTMNIDLPKVTAGIESTTQQTLKTITLTGNTGTSGMQNGNLTIGIPMGGGTGGIKAQIDSGQKADIGTINLVGDVNNSEVKGGVLTIDMKTGSGGGSDINVAIEGETPKVLTEIEVKGNVGSSTTTGGKLSLVLPSQEVDIGDGSYEIYHKVKIEGNKGNTRVDGQVLHIDLPSGGGTGSDTIQGKIENEDPKTIKTVQIIGSVSGSQIANETMTINVPRPLVVNAQIDDSEKKAINNIKLTGNNTSSHIVDGTLTIDLPASGGGGTSTPLKGQVGDTGTEGDVAKILVKGNITGSELSSNVLTLNIPNIPPSTSEYYVGAYDDFEDLKRAVPNPVEDKSFGYAKETDSDFNTTYYVPYLYTSNGWRTLDVKSYFYYTKKGETTPTQVASIKQNDKIQIDSKGEIDLSGLADTTPEYFRGYFESLSDLDGDVPTTERVKNKTYAFVRQDASVTDPGAERQLLMYMWRQTGLQTSPSWQITAPAGSIALVNTNTYKPIFGIDKNPMIERDSNGVITILDTSIPKVHCHIMDKDGSSVVQDAEFMHLKYEDGTGTTTYNQSTKNLTIHRAQRRLPMGTNPDTDSSTLTDNHYEGSIFLNETDHCWWGYADKNQGKKWTRVAHAGMSNQVESLSERFGPHLQLIPDTVTLTQDHPLWRVSGWTYATSSSKAIPSELWSKSGGYFQTFIGGETYHPDNPRARIQIFYAEDDMVSYKRNWGTVNNQWTAWVKISFNPGDLSSHNNDPMAHRASHKYYKVLSFGCKYSDIKAPTAGIAYFIPFKDYNLLASSDGDHINDGDPCVVPYDGSFRIRGHIGFRGIDQTKVQSVSGEWFVTLEKKEHGGTSYRTVMKAKYPHHSTSIHEPHLKWDFESVTLEKGDRLAFTVYFKPTTAGEDITKTFPDLGYHHLRSYVAIDTPGSDAGSAIGEAHRKLMGAFVSEGDGGMFLKETGVGTQKYVATTEWIDPAIFSMTNEKV